MCAFVYVRVCIQITLKGLTDLIMHLKFIEYTKKLLPNIKKYFSLRKLVLLIYFPVLGLAFYFTFWQSFLFEQDIHEADFSV